MLHPVIDDLPHGAIMILVLAYIRQEEPHRHGAGDFSDIRQCDRQLEIATTTAGR
jgi:hypothetical protein